MAINQVGSVPGPAECPDNRACPFCNRTDLVRFGSIQVIPSEDGIPGSVLLMPRQHRISHSAMTDAERRDLAAAIDLQMQTWSQSRGRDVHANLVWNMGSLAGQTVSHLHAHLIPRDGSDLLPGYGARWWLKSDIRFARILRLVARANPQARRSDGREP